MEQDKQEKMSKNKIRGTIYVLISAICFSTGGILIKLIPWSSMTIQGVRSILAIPVIAGFMLIRHQRFVWNKTVILGAAFNTVMALSFVAATKITTAANAIVLQFTEPVFVILLMWLIYKKKPGKDAVAACIVVLMGILCFFSESLGGGAMVGNLLAILAGFTYALVMMMKKFDGADFESSLIVSNVISFVISIPFCTKETEFSMEIWLCMLILGVVQYGFAYIFLSKGLDSVSPVTASLTSTIEPILNPVLVAIFYKETISIVAIIGAILVVGAATVYNVRQSLKS